jgi:dTDP-L-rhamnose 4-epimerase
VVILVTGGAGFVGAHLVTQLCNAGHEVRVVDRLHRGAHGRIPDDLDARAEWCWADLADPEVAARAVAGVDAVSHQAAMVGLGDNDVATATMLAALHDRDFRGPLVLASSMVVYGEGAYRCGRHGAVVPGSRTRQDLDAQRWEPSCPECGRELEPVAVLETAPPDPRNVYAATKLHQEHLCGAYAREHDARLVVLRYHNVYGPGMPRDTPYAGVASIFRSALEAGRAPQVFEDGGQIRDFVHVTDVARANVLALAADARPGTYNVASGQPHTVFDMADAIAAAHPGAPRPQVVPRFRLGDVRHVFGSAAAARDGIGFSARVRFSDGMRAFATAPLRHPPTGATPYPGG